MTDLLYFEDLQPGQAFDLGSITVTREEIIGFAEEFDPQPFHLDDEAGEASLLGGLAASGWHTGSLVMRLLAANLLNRTSGRGSPGISKLQWKQPVFPGDTLTARAEILETKNLRTKPDLGIAIFRITAIKQNDTKVIHWENPILFAKRDIA